MRVRRAPRRRHPKIGRLTEKVLQQQIVTFARQIGLRPKNFSQPRATMQTDGIPDLLFFCPPAVRSGRLPPGRIAAFTFETKCPDGVMSASQVDFAQEAEYCQLPHYVGGWRTFAEALRHVGMVREANGIPTMPAEFPADWREAPIRKPKVRTHKVRSR